MSFEKKYLKYKEKYFKLRTKFNHVGGASLIRDEGIKIKIEDEEMRGLLFSLDYTIDGNYVLLSLNKFNDLYDEITQRNFVLIQKSKNGLNARQVNRDLKSKLTNESILEIIPMVVWEEIQSLKSAEKTAPKITAIKELDAVKGRVNLDNEVPITHQVNGDKFKIDNTHCRVYMFDAASRRERSIRVMFDTGNHANTLISEQYVIDYGLKRIPKNASKINISKFNLLMHLIGNKEIKFSEGTDI